jgi:peptidoglycan hydrolase CwlO-like protein
MRRIVVLGLIAFLGFPAEASARDLTGIYLKRYSNQVEYFNLTEQKGYLTGYYQIVRFDPNASDGLDRIQFSVSGTVDGGRALLHLSSSTSGSYDWTADATWSGFVVSLSMESGQIRQVTFERSSVEEVNTQVAGLTQKSTTAKSYLNTVQDLNWAQNKLAELTASRPRLVDALHQAQARVRASVAKKKQLEQRVADLQPVATQKHKDADTAKAAATNSDELYQANQLEYDANSADYNVNSAKYDVNSAQYDLNSSLSDMRQAQAEITNLDNQVAALKARISNDKYILAHVH